MNQTLRVCVVGGSLGGLNAALHLRDLGYKVEIYERSRMPLIGLGAGIVLNPATTRYLLQKEPTEIDTIEIDAISVRSSAVRYMDAQGAWVAERPDRYRFSSYNALYRGLFDAFGQEYYHLGQAMVNFEQRSEGVRVHFASGSTVECDLLICADGIRSSGRQLLMRQANLDATPRYAGYVAWRGIVGAHELAPELYTSLRSAISYHLMPHSHLLTYPIPMVDRPSAMDAPFINWLWYRNVDEGQALDRLMTDREGVRRDLSIAPGAVDAQNISGLMQDAAHLPPPLAQLVGATAKPFLQMIVDYEPPFLAADRVCLIGDAAVVARPHIAAGSAKAAEDGYQLAESLRQFAGEIAPALHHWQERQLALGRSVLQRARAAGDRSQKSSTWVVGEPLPFGLYTEGDSLITERADLQ